MSPRASIEAGVCPVCGEACQSFFLVRTHAYGDAVCCGGCAIEFTKPEEQNEELSWD
jgi:hypothetical protein